tara:strand:- start:882 stop:1268 length:387 start_codon:yes stop_codon:yes gene_type:complete
MAEGFAKEMLKDKNHIVQSAGVMPDTLNEIAILVMKEEGIDISSQYSKKIETFDLGSFDIVVTVCDKAKGYCPVVKHVNLLHYSFYDPVLATGTKNQKLIVYRKVRDQIKTMVNNLLLNYNILCQETN